MTEASKTLSRLVTIGIFIAFLIAAWFVAPIILPTWRWTNLTESGFTELAGKHKVPVAKLRTVVTMQVRYNPRGDGDPSPWQIITSDPAWKTLDPENNMDEQNLLVRCTLLSDRTGEPPGTMFIGGTYKDRYYKAKGWRLPPGAFRYNAKRPVVVVDMFEFDKLDIGASQVWENDLRSAPWENDDSGIAEREDGWKPRGAN